MFSGTAPVGPRTGCRWGNLSVGGGRLGIGIGVRSGLAVGLAILLLAILLLAVDGLAVGLLLRR